MRIVMDDETIHSFIGHLLIETTSAYCEKKKIDFEKTFLDKNTQVETPDGKCYVFDANLTINGVNVQIDEFVKHLQDEYARLVKEEASRIFDAVMCECLESHRVKMIFDDLIDNVNVNDKF